MEMEEVHAKGKQGTRPNRSSVDHVHLVHVRLDNSRWEERGANLIPLLSFYTLQCMCKTLMLAQYGGTACGESCGKLGSQEIYGE